MGRRARHIGFMIPMSHQTLSPEQFVRRFETASRKLWCLAVGILGCRLQAEDVLQEAALTALQRLTSFRAGSNFEAWMAQIVRFTAFNLARRHYRRREIGSQDQLPGPSWNAANPRLVDDSGCLDSEQSHFDDSVIRALGQLSELPRASFLLRTLMGLSYREVSELLGIPEGTAMSHVHRSRATLRELLEADVSFDRFAGWRAS